MNNFAKQAVIVFAVFFCTAGISASSKTELDWSKSAGGINENLAVASLTPSQAARQAQSRYLSKGKKIALQAGHWENDDLPAEQVLLRKYKGAEAGGKTEWAVNLSIARQTKKLLERQGYEVEILPATVPVGYSADAFIAIHADGSLKPSSSGFKVSPPAFGSNENSVKLSGELEKSYGTATKIKNDPNVTGNMRYYYAFNYRSFKHAIDPKTPAAILETGYLTGQSDRDVIVDHPEVAATGIATAVEKYFGNA
ncbi:MAG TPA: N-acetylmuramoyl-L-alanine amidase [Candidatus Bathyarchaeia archaeon]|nr:N-acetylmuramoyl-L-alanine amidase [Candidatus Bathyarchaeia archaeon]